MWKPGREKERTREKERERKTDRRTEKEFQAVEREGSKKPWIQQLNHKAPKS